MEVYKIRGDELRIALAGGISGAISRTCIAPLSRVKLLFQVHHMKTAGVASSYTQNGILGMIREIYRNEGLLGFWKGNGTTVIKKLPYSSIKYLSYEGYKNILTPTHKNHSSDRVNFLSGCLAAATAVFLTYPLDLVQVHLASQTTQKFYQGIFGTIQKIWKSEGFFQLYRGLGAAFLTVIPYLGINLSLWEKLKKNTQNFPFFDQMPRPLIAALCGAVSGSFASTVTFPLDVVRRHIQLNAKSAEKKKEYEGYLDCVLKIVRRHGLLGLYRGLSVHYVTVIPSVALSLGSYELMKSVFSVSQRKLNHSPPINL